MSDPKAGPQTAAVDEAINQVLKAERDAREAVERCRSEAAIILAVAEDRVRRITQRAEQRAKAAHRLADRAVECALRELLGGEGGEEPGQTTSLDEARVTHAVEVLVEELMGDKS